MGSEGFEKQLNSSVGTGEIPVPLKEGQNLEADAENTLSLPRREFLLGLSALMVQGFMPALGRTAHGEGVVKSADHTHENIDEYQYREYMRTLRDASLMLPYERLALYLHLKDGESRWILREPQGVSHSMLDTPEEILRMFNEGVEHIEIAHTHPLELVYRDPGILSRARKGEVPLLAMPPSFMDISSAMFTIAPLERGLSNRIAWKVVDPAGVWTYALDRDNPYFTKISGAIEGTIRLSTQLGTRKDVQTLVEKHGLKDVDPRAVLEVLLEKQKELSPASRALLQKIVDVEESLMDPLTAKIIEIESLRAGFSQDAPELTELRETYAHMGVTMKFSPHQAR